MPVISHAEENQIVAVNRLTPLRRKKIESFLIFLCRDLRIDFTLHTRNRFLRNIGGLEKGFTGHAEITLCILGRHAPLIAKSKKHPVPREVPPDPGQLSVNRAGSISAGKRDAELVSFRQGRAGMLEDELGRV